jgi:hypothetical protein
VFAPGLQITLDGRLFPNQWKRNAVLLVVKHLCDKGVSPSEAAQAMDMGKRGQGGTHPTLLALEEAHHYLRSVSEPSEPVAIPLRMSGWQRKVENLEFRCG